MRPLRASGQGPATRPQAAACFAALWIACSDASLPSRIQFNPPTLPPPPSQRSRACKL